MFIAIANILSNDEISAICARIAEKDFASGKATAGGHAKAVKQNEQLAAKTAEPVLKKVEKTLLSHPVFSAAARPKRLVRLMISRYRPGMHYGLHVDEPLIDGVRTDLSFTLFLSQPEDCEGGELVIEENDQDRSFKLEAGSLILYPATTLHRVAPVTTGERLAVVGWVRSLIRSNENRETLFDLDNAIAALRQANADRAVLDRLYKVRVNLIRQWAED